MKDIKLYSITRKLLYQGQHNNIKEAVEFCINKQINLNRINLHGTNLKNANFDGWQVRGARLTRANLRGANITEAQLYQCDFSNANLNNACFCYSDLSHCQFYHAFFKRTDFSEASVDYSCFDWPAPAELNLSGCYSAKHIQLGRGYNDEQLPAFLLTNHLAPPLLPPDNTDHSKVVPNNISHNNMVSRPNTKFDRLIPQEHKCYKHYNNVII